MATTVGSRAASRRVRHLACLLGASVAGLVAAAAAPAATPDGVQHRVSFSGNDTNRDVFAVAPAVAENARTGEYLMVWTRFGPGRASVVGRLADAAGTPLGPEFPITEEARRGDSPSVAYDARANVFMVAYTGNVAAGEREVYVRRVSAAGVPLGADVRISRIGPDGSAAYLPFEPDIAWNPVRGEHLVAWSGTAGTPGEFEVFIQRITGDGAEIGPDDRRVSSAGPDGDTTFGAGSPAVAVDERRGEYMVAWSADDDTGGYVSRDYEIRVQHLNGDGDEIGEDDRPVSSAGPPGDNEISARFPDIAYDPVNDRHMVAWRADDDQTPPTASGFEIFGRVLQHDGAPVTPDDLRLSSTGPYSDVSLTQDVAVSADTRAGEFLVAWSGSNATLPLDKLEVFGQRVSASGAEIGGDTRISQMPAPDAPTVATSAAVAFGTVTGRHLVAWEGQPSVAPPAPGKSEVYSVRVAGGTPVTLAAQQCRVLPALPPPPAGDPSSITLSATQLQINQRIDQAAIRRANAVQAWLDAGVQARDLCQAALGPEELVAGSIAGYTGVPATYGPADPRPVVVAPPTPGGGTVTLNVGQMLTNQRISQAAIRRLNALKARLDAGLTGGDIVDGAVGRAQLRAGTSVLFTPVAPPPAASVTDIAPATPGDPDKVTLSVEQMRINQRISQAAVNRANELIHRIGQGIGPEEVRNGTLTAADLAPGMVVSTTP